MIKEIIFEPFDIKIIEVVIIFAMGCYSEVIKNKLNCNIIE